jgi:hypothetical protein
MKFYGMKKNSTVIVGLVVSIISSALVLFSADGNKQNIRSRITEDDEEKRDEYTTLRWLHEFNMIKDPVTNRIPDVAMKELAQAHSVPEKQYEILDGAFGSDNLNTYTAAGPNNIGGRTRAIAFDKRNSNIIIAGCISGGIYRSADAGTTWTRVTPENQIHNFSSVVQDPRSGFENTWYAGGGEPIANSAAAPGAFYLSMPIWKSIDNGVTWSSLPTNIPGLGVGTLENFDHPFDIVHKLAIDPATGNIYVAGHRRLIRSLDGGNTWEQAFSTTTAAGSATGQMDIAITNTGKFVLAVNGGMPDATTRGVWTSTTGALNSWTRIAGGQVLNVDSVDGWRGNDYSGGSKRILIGLAPSNQNHMYVLYENGFDQSKDLKPEVDMYKLDITGSPSWTNLSANMPDFPNNNREGVDPIAVQGGYDMLVTVKPDDENAVFIGGTCLYRSTNGFTTTAATAWIGGYGNTLPTLTIYPNSHPDIHALTFDPSSPSRAICGNDGGIQVTSDVMANVTTTQPVNWTVIRNYQTLQYYHIALDPGAARNNFIGGAQDNGTQLRLDGSDDHTRIVGGDGGAAGMNKANGSNQFVYCSSQLGDMYRVTLTSGTVATFNNIKPSGLTATPGTTGFGDFVTYFKIDFDNPEDAYYVNFNRLFRTTSSSTVSSGGWTELTGVSQAVNPTNGTNISISALESSRGDYFPSHALYIGTSNGKILRLDNPRNAAATAAPTDITPSQIIALGAPVYISDIAANPNNDEELLAVVSNYAVGSNNTAINIWWTNNAKSSTPTWKLAEGNLTLPSVRSAQIVVKKDGSGNAVTEYYVGTSVGLYSAVNIATTLQNNQAVNWVREGGNVLNFAVVETLDYRPQDNILAVGTHGNGLFYTNVGTPNFTPNLNTGVVEPVRNDKKFIQLAYPTLVTNNRIDYRIGNMFTIPAIVIQVYNSAGQLLIRKEDVYQSGSLNLGRLPSGNYVLSITSKDYKQQFVQPFVKR